MKITFDKDEQAIILGVSHSSGFSSGRLADHLVAIYEANIHEDLKSALEDLEAYVEVEA